MGRLFTFVLLSSALLLSASELPYAPHSSALIICGASFLAFFSALLVPRLGFAVLGLGLPIIPGFLFEGMNLFVAAWLCGCGMHRYFRERNPDGRIFHSGFEAGEMGIALLTLAAIIGAVRTLHAEYDHLLMQSIYAGGGIRGVLKYLIEHTREWSTVPFLVLGYPLALLLFAEFGRRDEESISFAKGLALGAAISSIVLLLQVTNLFPALSFSRGAFWVFSERFGGLASDPNAFGVLAVLLIPFFVYLREEGGRLMVAGSALLVLAVPWTGSRTFWVGVGIFTVAALVSRLRAKRKQLSMVLAAAVICFGLAGQPQINDALQAGASSAGFKRVLETLNWDRGGEMLSNRIMFADIALEVWREAPILGVGLGKFYERQSAAAARVGADLGTWRDNANNFYLQVLAEQGLFGLALTLFAFHLLLVALSGGYEGSKVPLPARYFCWLFFLVLLTGPHLLFDEVKFVFAGVLAVLVRCTGPVAASRLVEEGKKALWWVLAGAFCAVVFYVPSAERSVVQGAYGKEDTPEGPIIWTSPTARFAICPGAAADLPIEFRIFHPDVQTRPVHVSFSLGGEGDLERTRVDVSSTDWQTTALKLPTTGGSRLWLTIHTSRSWSPAAAGLSADSRWFGAMLKYSLPVCSS